MLWLVVFVHLSENCKRTVCIISYLSTFVIFLTNDGRIINACKRVFWQKITNVPNVVTSGESACSACAYVGKGLLYITDLLVNAVRHSTPSNTRKQVRDESFGHGCEASDGSWVRWRDRCRDRPNGGRFDWGVNLWTPRCWVFASQHRTRLRRACCGAWRACEARAHGDRPAPIWAAASAAPCERSGRFGDKLETIARHPRQPVQSRATRFGAAGQKSLDLFHPQRLELFLQHQQSRSLR